MKVLFLAIQSKYSRLIEEPGLGSLAAYLSKHGHQVVVKRHFYENDMQYLCDYIKTEGIQLVGLNTYDIYFSQQILCAHKLKNSCDVMICMGGYTATYNAEKILREYSFVDFVIKGEGEIPMLSLVNTLQINDELDEIAGLCYRKNGEPYISSGCSIITNLDELPFANRELLKEQSNNVYQLCTSRGCTSTCTFCCSNSYWRDKDNKRRYRFMSPARVVDEIEHVLKECGKNRIAFTDNSFEDPGNDMKRQTEIADLIIERKIEVAYGVNYRVNFYKAASSTFIKKMISSGMCSVFLGVESGNQFDLNLYGKKTTVNECKNSIEFFSQFKELCVRIGFICLNPYSTKERIYQNIKFLKETGYASDFSNLTRKLIPFRGSEIFNQIESDGLLLINSDNFTFDYKFENREVYVYEKHMMDIQKKYPILNMTRHLCDVLPSILIHLKRETIKYGDYYANNLISNAQNQLKELDEMLNDRTAQWAMEIISASPEMYSQISTYYLEDREIAKGYKEMLLIRNKLYRELAIRNKKYLQYF